MKVRHQGLRLLLFAALSSACIGSITSPEGPGPSVQMPTTMPQSGVGGGAVAAGAGGSASGSGGTMMAGAGGAPGAGGSSQPVTPGAPPEATVRRLTKIQLANTVQAALGVTSTSLARIGADVRGSHGFENSVQGTAFTFDDAKAYLDFVEEVSFERIVPATVAGCALTAAAGEQCVRTFLETKAVKLLRRPLTMPEVTTWAALYTSSSRAPSTPEQGFRILISHLLFSPHFQYRTEFGGMGATGSAPVALTGFERASALSYLLWNSIPDDELFTAARTGALADPVQVKAQVARMLRSPQAQRFADLFTRGYLVLLDPSKDPALFPTFTPAVSRALVEQTTLWARQFLLSPSGTFAQLLTNSQVMATSATARWYGVSPMGLNDVPRLVNADPMTRAGFLTQPAVVASRTHADRTSPVLYGEYVASHLLCVHLGAPPLDAIQVDAALPANSTQRERSAARMANINCSGCHSILDPLGLPFEGYDPTGALSTAPMLDLSTVVAGSEDVDGPVAGPVDLSRKLSSSESVHSCFAKQMFRYVNGRYEKQDELPSIRQTGQQFFRASQGNIEQLVGALVQQDAFLIRARP
jgi:hypothetical protein